MSGSFRGGEYSKMGYCVNPIYSFINPDPKIYSRHFRC